MIENPVCMGCCVNSQFPHYAWNYPQQEQQTPSILALTDQEKLVLTKSVETFNAFMSLDKRRECDCTEFTDAIHRIQQLIALRVARRVNPEVWTQPNG